MSPAALLLGLALAIPPAAAPVSGPAGEPVSAPPAAGAASLPSAGADTVRTGPAVEAVDDARPSASAFPVLPVPSAIVRDRMRGALSDDGRGGGTTGVAETHASLRRLGESLAERTTPTRDALLAWGGRQRVVWNAWGRRAGLEARRWATRARSGDPTPLAAIALVVTLAGGLVVSRHRAGRRRARASAAAGPLERALTLMQAGLGTGDAAGETRVSQDALLLLARLDVETRALDGGRLPYGRRA
jgi:hypothetical protein